MASDRSLSDDEMRVDFRTDPTFVAQVMREMQSWEGQLKDRDDEEEVAIPVAAMNRMMMGMRAMVKAQTELGFLGLGNNDRGDRGVNCDYNPFNKINTGDF